MKVLTRTGFLSLALLIACSGGSPSSDPEQDIAIDGPDAGEDEPSPATCLDLDGDGYGVNCSLGADCDDANDTVFEECGVVACTNEAEGCTCDPHSKPVECVLAKSFVTEDGLLCKTGQRYCRNAVWTACIGIAAYGD